MTTVPQLAQALQTGLTTTADAAARRSGFVQRRSKLTGAAFVPALVFGWVANPRATVEALAQAAGCLEDVLAAAVRVVVSAEPVAIPLLQRFTAVVLLDTSTLALPAALADWWPGCGGGHGQNTAALKLGVRLDLCGGTLEGPRLCDGRTHDSTTPLQTAPLPRGALRLADLGFFDLAVFKEMAAPARGVFWLSRLHCTTDVYDQEGRRWDVLDLLEAQTQTQTQMRTQTRTQTRTAPSVAEVDLAVRLGVRQRVPARLLAVRVPPEVANQRRRRLRAEAKRRGKTPRPRPGLV